MPVDIDRESFLRDIPLEDGTMLRLRPVKPTDRDEVKRFYDVELSDTSSYMRFFGIRPHLSDEFLDRLCEFDPSSHITIVGIRQRQVVAVASYFAGKNLQVEAAFAVADRLHSNGIATLMLEDLAAIAKGAGWSQMIAQTMPDNRAMLKVFGHVGLRERHRFDGGFIAVEMDLGDDAELRRRSDDRDWTATVVSMQPLLRPRSVVVVGASTNPTSPGHRIAANLADSYTGSMAVVRPDGVAIAGLPGYAAIGAVPFPVDLAIIAVPQQAVPEVIESCGRAGVRSLVVITAGFSEHGGETSDADLVLLAHRYGMRMLGPNCFGVIDSRQSLNATFGSRRPEPGGIAFASQSGGLGIALLAEAADRHVGVSSFVSLGNRADVSSNDLLCAFAEDPDTRVVLLYLESLGNPRRFLPIARRAAAVKPVVVLKAGRSSAGARAAASHTAALASDDAAVEALLNAAAVIRVDTLEELFDVGVLLERQSAPDGARVAFVGNAGGPLILAADSADFHDLAVPVLSDSLRDRIAELVPNAASTLNPVDLLATVSPTALARVVSLIGASGEVDAIVIASVPLVEDDVERVCEALEAVGCDIPLVVSMAGAPGRPGRLPIFKYGEAAVSALARAVRWNTERQARLADDADTTTTTTALLDEPDWIAVRRAVRDAPCDDAGWMETARLFEMLRSIRLPTTVTQTASTADEAVVIATRIAGTVVLKANVPGLLHKSDVGAVILGLQGDEAVREAYETFRLRFPTMNGVDIQVQAPAGSELLIGARQDPSCGPLVVVAAGGVEAELLGDSKVLAAPVTPAAARAALLGLRTARRLTGFRGSSPVDLDALVRVVVRVSRLVELVPEIVELDLNPVIAAPNGAVIVDARARVDVSRGVVGPVRTTG